MTDLHLDDFMANEAGIDGRRNVLSVLSSIEERGIKDLVLTGDFGPPASLEWLTDTVAGHGLRRFLILGNHDKLSDFERLPEAADYIKPDGLYYSRIMAEVSCIFLDSSKAQIGAGQLGWLEARLQEATKNVAVFTHYPVLDCGHTVMDRLYRLKNREAVAEVLYSSGRRISIFCGHYHTYHEQVSGGISQYVTPSTLLQIKKYAEKPETESTRFGYRSIHLSPDKITTEVTYLT
jgi:3',5'-cyclic AMP phosphodiesterase CpdA